MLEVVCAGSTPEGVKLAESILRASSAAGAFPAEDELTLTRAALAPEELDELEDEELEELEEELEELEEELELLEVLELSEGGSELLRKSSRGTNSGGSFLSGYSSISTPV